MVPVKNLECLKNKKMLNGESASPQKVMSLMLNDNNYVDVLPGYRIFKTFQVQGSLQKKHMGVFPKCPGPLHFQLHLYLTNHICIKGNLIFIQQFVRSNRSGLLAINYICIQQRAPVARYRKCYSTCNLRKSFMDFEQKLNSAFPLYLFTSQFFC